MLTVSDDPLYNVISVLQPFTPSTTTDKIWPPSWLTSALSANSRRAPYPNLPHPFTADESLVQPDGNKVQRDLFDKNSLHLRSKDSAKLSTTQLEIVLVGSFVLSNPIPLMSSLSSVHNMALPSSSNLSAGTLPPRCHHTKILSVPSIVARPLPMTFWLSYKTTCQLRLAVSSVQSPDRVKHHPNGTILFLLQLKKQYYKQFRPLQGHRRS